MKLVYALIFSVLLIGCGNSEDAAIKQKELELKEREIALKEKEFAQKETKTLQEKSPTPIKQKRKLRYVYASNGGLIGFFSDGTTAGCPRCDLLRENIKALYSQSTNGNYQIIDGALIINGNDRMDFNDRGWAMMDYTWLVDL